MFNFLAKGGLLEGPDPRRRTTLKEIQLGYVCTSFVHLFISIIFLYICLPYQAEIYLFKTKFNVILSIYSTTNDNNGTNISLGLLSHTSTRGGR